MNRVVYAIDNNPQYFDFLPIAEASWRRLGWPSLVAMVNTDAEPVCNAEFIHLRETRIKSGWAAMPARFLMANHFSGLGPCDVLMTSDADAIALSAPWMDKAWELAHKGYMVSIAHDWSAWNVVAAWYLMATVKTWRELLPWTLGELVTEYLEELQGSLGHSFDERFMHRDIYSHHKDRFRFILRPNGDRINSQSLENICDIHCHIGPRVFEL